MDFVLIKFEYDKILIHEMNSLMIISQTHLCKIFESALYLSMHLF